MTAQAIKVSSVIHSVNVNNKFEQEYFAIISKSYPPGALPSPCTEDYFKKVKVELRFDGQSINAQLKCFVKFTPLQFDTYFLGKYRIDDKDFRGYELLGYKKEDIAKAAMYLVDWMKARPSMTMYTKLSIYLYKNLNYANTNN